MSSYHTLLKANKHWSGAPGKIGYKSVNLKIEFLLQIEQAQAQS